MNVVDLVGVDRPTCLVLFDGMGLSRLGLLRAGFYCVGVELDATKHALAKILINDHYGYDSPSLLANVLSLSEGFVHQFDAVWCSPPCQIHSVANTYKHTARPDVSQDLIQWSLGNVPTSPLATYTGVVWVENVWNKYADCSWGTMFNQAQFQEWPTQSRSRVIGGRYPPPQTLRPSMERYDHVMGLRCEEDPTTRRIHTMRMPARIDASVAMPPDAPGFRNALTKELPPDIAAQLRAKLHPVRGLVPTLLATEGRCSPGILGERWPKIYNKATDTDYEETARQLLGHHEPTCVPIIKALLARDYYYQHSSRGCSRHYRRRITLREALWIMAVPDCDPVLYPNAVDSVAIALEQAKPVGVTQKQWTCDLIHGLGNGVPPIMAFALGQAALHGLGNGAVPRENTTRLGQAASREIKQPTPSRGMKKGEQPTHSTPNPIHVPEEPWSRRLRRRERG